MEHIIEDHICFIDIILFGCMAVLAVMFVWSIIEHNKVMDRKDDKLFRQRQFDAYPCSIPLGNPNSEFENSVRFDGKNQKDVARLISGSPKYKMENRFGNEHLVVENYYMMIGDWAIRQGLSVGLESDEVYRDKRAEA